MVGDFLSEEFSGVGVVPPVGVYEDGMTQVDFLQCVDEEVDA